MNFSPCADEPSRGQNVPGGVCIITKKLPERVGLCKRWNDFMTPVGEASRLPSQAIFDTDQVYFMRVNGNKMMVKSPGVIVPMTGQTSIVEFELVKAD